MHSHIGRRPGAGCPSSPGQGPSRQHTLALCEETGLALPKKPLHHLQALTHSLTRHLGSPSTRFLQPLPQTKQQLGQTCCLPCTTKTTETQTVQLPASRRRKFPHAPGVIRKGSGSARQQGPCTAKHLVFGSQDSAISLMFIRHFVSLRFSGSARMGQGRVEGMQTKAGEH